MKNNTEAALAWGVALGAMLSALIPKDWPIWQEVAVIGVVCALVYAVAKAVNGSNGSETESQ
jgi:hypothetical protein